jgi:hypothetical protein
LGAKNHEIDEVGLFFVAVDSRDKGDTCRSARISAKVTLCYSQTPAALHRFELHAELCWQIAPFACAEPHVWVFGPQTSAAEAVGSPAGQLSIVDTICPAGQVTSAAAHTNRP